MATPGITHTRTDNKHNQQKINQSNANNPKYKNKLITYTCTQTLY